MWCWCSVKIHSNSFFCETLYRYRWCCCSNSDDDGVVIVTIRPGKHHEIKVLKPKRFVVCANSE